MKRQTRNMKDLLVEMAANIADHPNEMPTGIVAAWYDDLCRMQDAADKLMDAVISQDNALMTDGGLA